MRGCAWASLVAHVGARGCVGGRGCRRGCAWVRVGFVGGCKGGRACAPGCAWSAWARVGVRECARVRGWVRIGARWCAWVRGWARVRANSYEQGRIEISENELKISGFWVYR